MGESTQVGSFFSARMRDLLFAVFVFNFFVPTPLWATDSDKINILRIDRVFIIPQAALSSDHLQRLTETIQRVREETTVASLIRSGFHQLELKGQISNSGLETTKFQNAYRGLEVVGAMVFHHSGPKGNDISNYMSSFDLDTTPTLSASEAWGIASTLMKNREMDAAPSLKILPDPNDGTAARLVYWVTLSQQNNQSGRDILIDAHTGTLIADISHEIPIISELGEFSTSEENNKDASLDDGFTRGPGSNESVRYGRTRTEPPKSRDTGSLELDTQTASAPIRIYSTNPDCQKVDMKGYPTGLDIKRCQLLTEKSALTPEGNTDEAAQNAFKNSQAVLDYYLGVHGRNSYDNKASAAISVVHIGEKFNNAFWNTNLEMMAYGDGDGVNHRSFTSALDIAGHEMTHGVISKTAQLISKGESGALNEAYADFFGKMIADDGTWTIGREIFIDPSRRGIRDLENPGSMMAHYRVNNQYLERPYPSTVQEMFTTTPQEACEPKNDNCYIHVNATIPGHAAYLITGAIGRERAEKLYFITLTQYLNQTATFTSSRKATLKACAQLFDQEVCDRVKAGFEQVGM